MIVRISLYLTMLGIIAGCTGLKDYSNSEINRFHEKYAAIDASSDIRTAGPYKYECTRSCNEICIIESGKEVSVLLRGIVSTGDKDTDVSAKRTIDNWLRACDVYLIENSVKRTNGIVFAMIATPGSQQFVQKDENTGNHIYQIDNFILLQVPLVLFGETVVDRSDTEHPYFNILCQAEDIARKEKRGYWKNKPRQQEPGKSKL